MHYCDHCGQPVDPPMPAPQSIGDFTLEVAAVGKWQLRKGERVQPVEPRMVEVLLLFARRGRVTTETLVALLFMESEDCAIARVYVSKVRRALRAIGSSVAIESLATKGRSGFGYVLQLPKPAPPARAAAPPQSLAQSL